MLFNNSITSTMAKPKLKYFRFRETSNAIELVCLFHDMDDSVENEAYSVFAMLYYQTRNHIKIDLFPVHYLSLNFVTRLMNLAKELREKKRVLILSGLNPSLYHFLHRFKMENTIFLHSEPEQERKHRTKFTPPPTKEEILALFPNRPKVEEV
jgi:anti-anti-sigma regulatory factor